MSGRKSLFPAFAGLFLAVSLSQAAYAATIQVFNNTDAPVVVNVLYGTASCSEASLGIAAHGKSSVNTGSCLVKEIRAEMAIPGGRVHCAPWNVRGGATNFTVQGNRSRCSVIAGLRSGNTAPVSK